MKLRPILNAVGQLTLGLIVGALCVSIGSILLCRTSGSPWHLRFQSRGDSILVTISCAKPMIPPAVIVLLNTAASVPVDEEIDMRGAQRLPLGTLTFEDTVMRPGRITMNICGHEIDAMQRALIVDKNEYLWKNNLKIEIESSNKTLETTRASRPTH